MGDSKPSQFLGHLKRLAPDVPKDFLRSIWFSRLPPNIQTILAGQDGGNLDTASQMANRIAEVAPLFPPQHPSPRPPTQRVCSKTEDLSRQVLPHQWRIPITLSFQRQAQGVGRPPPQHKAAQSAITVGSTGDSGTSYDKRQCTPPSSFRLQENGSERR